MLTAAVKYHKHPVSSQQFRRIFEHVSCLNTRFAGHLAVPPVGKPWLRKAVLRESLAPRVNEPPCLHALAKGTIVTHAWRFK